MCQDMRLQKRLTVEAEFWACTAGYAYACAHDSSAYAAFADPGGSDKKKTPPILVTTESVLFFGVPFVCGFLRETRKTTRLVVEGFR